MTLTVERIPNLTVMELRKELKSRGEEAKGNKKVLVDRLTAAVKKEVADEPPAPKRSRGRPPKKRPSSNDEPLEETKKEEHKEKNNLPEPATPASPKANESEPTSEKKKPKTAATGESEDDNPLSEARMKRRAERFGMPWPRENGNEKVAKRAKISKEPAISPYVLTSDEIKQREARAKRFADDKPEEVAEK